jgi:hypothetical protein
MKLKLQHFKILKDIETMKSRYDSDKKLNFYLENLNNLIVKNQNMTNMKNKKMQESLISKQVKLENLRKTIKVKYDTYDNLNKTFSKLSNINKQYNEVLKTLEDSMKILKKRKRIILGNISERKKELRVKEKTINSVLEKYENQISKMNLNLIKYELDKNVRLKFYIL